MVTGRMSEVLGAQHEGPSSTDLQGNQECYVCRIVFPMGKIYKEEKNPVLSFRKLRIRSDYYPGNLHYL